MTRIVAIEEPCVHGKYRTHSRFHAWRHGLVPCPGGSRRVLTEGQLVQYRYPIGQVRDYAHKILDGQYAGDWQAAAEWLADVIWTARDLDALADQGET